MGPKLGRGSNQVSFSTPWICVWGCLDDNLHPVWCVFEPTAQNKVKVFLPVGFGGGSELDDLHIVASRCSCVQTKHHRTVHDIYVDTHAVMYVVYVGE